MSAHRDEDEAQAKRAARAEFVTRLFILTLVVLLVAAVGVIFAIRHTQTSNTKKTDNTVQTLAVVKALAKQINSCVTPGQPCYQRGQERTGAAVANLEQIAVLAAACAVDVTPDQSVPDRAAQIAACITAHLKAAQ